MLGKLTFMMNSVPLLVFVVGVYAGIYADQHYQIPKVDDPKDIWKRLEEFSAKYRKDKSE